MSRSSILHKLFVAFCLLLFIGGAGVRAQSGFEVFDRADLPGGDYLSIEGGTYNQCAAQCARDGACQAFTYNKAKRVCFLKDAVGQPKRFAGAVSGRKTGAAAPARASAAPVAGSVTFEVFEDADMPGGDFQTLRNTSLDQCKQTCASRADCQAFTQNMAKNVCFLKSGAGEPQRFAGAVSGRRVAGGGQAVAAAPKGKQSGGFTMYDDADLPGGDGSIIAQDAGSADACKLQCLFNDGCDAFTYNHKAKACLGKSRGHIGGDRMQPTPFKGATSGMKATPEKVAAARKDYFARGPKVPEADLGWRADDTRESFVQRVRAAAKPMGGACEAERKSIAAIAASLKAGIETGSVVAGTPVALKWSGRPEAKAPPVWLMVSADGPVRFTAPGFYALTPEAIAPFGISVDEKRTRALTTLFGKAALDGGTVEIKPLRAGPLNVAVRAVGYLRACEEAVSHEVATATIAVTASAVPTFQVRDPFSFEAPKKTWLSPDGTTKLDVFDGRFRLIDLASGAFVADREGVDPYYSPTGRFVTFSVGEMGKEVLDTFDGTIVESTDEVLGWENRDSFLVRGGSNGNVNATSILTGTGAGSYSTCRAACPARQETYTLDLENDFIHVSGQSDRLSGAPQQLLKLGTEPKPTTLRTVAEQTGVAPVYFPERWNFRGGLFFAPFEHWIDPAGSGQLDALQQEEKDHMFFAEALTTGAGAPQVAGLQPVGIGQWRGATRLDRPKAAGDTIKERLSELGLSFSPLVAPIFVSTKPAGMDPVEVLNYMQPEIAAKIVEAVPSAKGAFVDTKDNPHCNPDGAAPNGLERIYSSFDQAMEFKIGQRSIWLTIYVCAEGSAAFYYPNFHFFDSEYDQGFLRIDGANPGESAGNSCTQDISHCNFDARLYGDRYLLIWSTQSRGIMLFDINERKTTYLEFDLGRGDLLKEAFYSLETQHITQLNSDGSFYVYDVPAKKRVLEGRYVDDETIAWTPDLRFDASPEGANYVYLRFPGQSGQYAFQQFADAVKRPGLVREVLERRYTAATQALTLPPTLSGQIATAGGRLTGAVEGTGARALRVYQDGLLTDTIAMTEGAATRIDVAHLPGARWASLVAFDDKGLASLPIGVEVREKDDAPPTIHALTVGIDRYKALQGLRYAGKDASTLLAALESQNGTSFRLGVTAKLLDEAASAEAILARAEEMVATAKKGETIVFSFAGHGVTGADGRFFLATTATEASRIEETALAWDRLAAVLAKAEARVVVFLDACHSGAAGTGLFATNDDAVSAVLKGVPSGLLVFSASKGRQFSEESAAVGGGLFTNAVADVVARERAKHDLDGNGAIEASELYVGVKRMVADRSEGRQVPWLARNEMVGDFSIF